jgi:CDP-alcohol phosphatidyltransferase
MSRGVRLSIPNLITLARILLVPVVIWAITSGEMRIAFLLFFAAGVSDAVDGFLAKRFGMQTELGAYLDPLADKAMIVSIYVALGIANVIPRWLVILVVSRDHAVMAGGQAGDAQAAPCFQAQYGRADLARAPGACGAWIRIRRRHRDQRAHGTGHALDLGVHRLLSRRVGAPHEWGGVRTMNRRIVVDGGIRRQGE